ncbi:hypothetical protein DRW41_12110 [Neobacillus piezotolerans]|uniref:DUF4367 domain-containing protein n=1 Tax=Neobacillus piezotolerans TaxID=2259171 RepID=A0A3D8GR35_9BACI|nr:hypothetical protein [Neobacillus piezotolerans]RDU36787.1 hypothetical protein DRW41_12110 [Neobacillus piezotolerans]
MNSQDEFRELESQLNSLPSKKLNPESFDEIHQRLMIEAEALDRRVRRGSILKKTAMGMAGAAALCMMLFLGFSMGPQTNSSESSKMSGQKNDAKVSEDRDASESAPHFNGKLVVETGDGATKEITDQTEIDNANDILVDAEWENAKMQMATPPDWKLNNRYLVWLTPSSDQLEIIVNGENKYKKLSKEDSEELYEIITGKKLGD